MESDADCDVIKRESAGRWVQWSQPYFRCEAMTPSRIGPACGIHEISDEFNFNCGPRFDQSDRYVHNREATSSNRSSASVTSLKIAAISSAEILAKSFSSGTTKTPQRSMDAGLTVSS